MYKQYFRYSWYSLIACLESLLITVFIATFLSLLFIIFQTGGDGVEIIKVFPLTMAVIFTLGFNVLKIYILPTILFFASPILLLLDYKNICINHRLIYIFTATLIAAMTYMISLPLQGHNLEILVLIYFIFGGGLTGVFLHRKIKEQNNE